MGNVLVGLAGWSYKDWKGRVYPDPEPPGFDALAYIADYFRCVELNNTFYRPPAPRMCEGWVRKTAHLPDFRFTAKLWQKFTHDKEGFTDRDVRLYRDGIAPLAQAGKFGALLLQFPWFFEDNAKARSRIEGIADAFRDLAPPVVEVRHASFGAPDFLEFLRGREIGFCNIDQPSSRTALTGTAHVTGPAGYIRFHGRNRKAWFSKSAGRDEKYDYLYTPQELERWVCAAQEMSETAPQTFVIANNHFQGKAPANAFMFKRMLGDETASVPEILRRAFAEALAKFP